MKVKNWNTRVEVVPTAGLKLKKILVFNYDYGDYIDIVYHCISYNNSESRGIGQWNIQLK